MAKSETSADGVDTIMDSLVEAGREGRNEVVETWARGCDRYARYFAALAKAQGPEGVFTATTDFIADGMEAFARGVLPARSLNGSGGAAANS